MYIEVPVEVGAALVEAERHRVLSAQASKDFEVLSAQYLEEPNDDIAAAAMAAFARERDNSAQCDARWQVVRDWLNAEDTDEHWSYRQARERMDRASHVMGNTWRARSDALDNLKDQLFGTEPAPTESGEAHG